MPFKKGHKINNGRKQTEQHKEKIRQKLKENKNSLGYKHTEKVKEIISLVNKGKIFSDEHIKRLSDSKRGKKLSEETKRKISNSLKGKRFSEIRKLNISNSLKGKKQPKNSKSKIGNKNPM